MGVLFRVFMYILELLVRVGRLVRWVVWWVLVRVFLMKVLKGFFVLGMLNLFCGCMFSLMLFRRLVNFFSLLVLLDVIMIFCLGCMFGFDFDEVCGMGMIVVVF